MGPPTCGKTDIVSAETVEAGDWEAAERPRLETVQVGGWPGLGGDVRFTLGRRHTILVGRNSAGKSLLVEGLRRAAQAAVGYQSPRSVAPASFYCETEIVDSRIAYEYRTRIHDADDEAESNVEGAWRWPWQERAWRLSDGQELWRIDESKLTINGGSPMPFAPGVGLLALEDAPQDPPTQAEPLRLLLRGVRVVPAGVPRSEGLRREVLVAGSGPEGSRRWRVPGASRVHDLAWMTVYMWERDRERYDEFRQILLDLKLVGDVAVKIYKDPRSDMEAGVRSDFASVLFDGINLGLQSDGTLRVAEIVSTLLQAGVRCLLIEEPETAVHPSLLGRLLALIDAYSIDRQIVVSTHSPQVVNWGRPDELRLVVREGDLTVVRPLEESDMARVHHHLQDDGTLSEFVYQRQRT